MYKQNDYDITYYRDICIDKHPAIWLIKNQETRLGYRKIIQRYYEINKKIYDERIKMEKIFNEKCKKEQQETDLKHTEREKAFRQLPWYKKFGGYYES